MNGASHDTRPRPGGIEIQGTTAQDFDQATHGLQALLQQAGLSDHVQRHAIDTHGLQAELRPESFAAWTPEHDTLALCDTLHLDPAREQDLEREILVAMLATPVPFRFPSLDELVSAVRIRRNIVQAARKTALAFDTTQAAERPEEYWRYDEDHGFVLQPGKSLIRALEKATQPEVSGKLYSFSCYRATEYVILLGIAQELLGSNPALYQQLEHHSEHHAIRSGKFHDVFLYEYGSMEAPLPPRYYVPGDRLWFRNPDAHSSDVTGYEGSWVFYLGNGQFTNFWKRNQPFSFASKCVELFHWRHATYRDAAGELQIDEAIVEARVRETMADPARVQEVLQRMVRLRDPKGVYAEGGCIDTTREYPRHVRPGTVDMVLPPL
jgi:Protein-glutamine gamma-glutamyltransferase